jgi:hypothetical protein
MAHSSQTSSVWFRRNADRKYPLNGISRTEQFTPVRLNAPLAPGMIVDLVIAGHDGRQLLAY